METIPSCSARMLSIITSKACARVSNCGRCVDDPLPVLAMRSFSSGNIGQYFTLRSIRIVCRNIRVLSEINTITFNMHVVMTLAITATQVF